MAPQDRLAKYAKMPGGYSTPREAMFEPKTSWVKQQKWDIPEPFVIKVAPVGGFIMKEDNPNQKYTTAEIRDQIAQSLEAGACSFHTHVREEKGAHTLNLKLYHEVIDPIKEKYGSRVVACGCPEGGATVADSLRPILEFEGVLETAPITVSTVNLTGNYSMCRTPEITQAHVEFMEEVGCKPEIVLHNLGDISLVRRWLIDPELLKRPYYFRLAVGNPGWGYIEDPYTLLECVAYMTRELRKLAPDCAIMLDMAGRPGLFMVPMAVMLGLIGVRVGMEDALYMYPHKDEMIVDNPSLVRKAVAVVESLGRKVATANDYRRFLGIPTKN